MRRLFTHDSLTGLPRGRWFIKKLQGNLKRSQGNISFAVFYIDVDNFQIINDIYGYIFGDRVLKQVAQRLEKYITSKDGIVSRIGSDEFLIFYPMIRDREKIYELANGILAEFNRPIICDNNKLYIGLSMGIAFYPDHGREAHELLRNANIAMYNVKDEGKNSFAIYDKSMCKEVIDAAIIKRDLKKAVKHSQFKLHYHPQIDLKSKEVACLEVLTRWEHPEKGLIYPNNFIPIAEENGLIVPLGDFILYSACKQLKEWQNNGFTGYGISINISPIQLQHRNFIDKVRDILDETGIDPCYLEFEITENSLIRYIDQTNDILAELRNMGIRISLDDFGTGYSSLSYLKDLPVDIIKIDRTFIKSIENGVERAITNAIIDLGHEMDLCITAEGVETKDQLNILRDQGCDRVQGFLFSKPLNNIEIENKVTEIYQQINAI